ncbi:ankyrin repeat domain-containing protein [Fulvivirga sediminis]|uniref:Ankyrin repeat domain-containing protein n=1 Tax=Fulvivirga sediminis TaxID=2803949 RepID=A0A937F8D4_9BACT|nr:ankyrin repeat domain-containing protein [Fulvivirga sediminis]MBL3656902.1 ankyrin repeat domain-containing protein [Fulvivirga sediminis]
MSFLDKLFGGEKKEEPIFQATQKFFEDHPESLEQVIKGGNLERIKSLLDASNFQKADENNHKPFFYATLYAKTDVIEYLFSLGSDFEEARKTPMSSAFNTLIESGSAEVLQTFINHGYIVPLGDKGAPVIQKAIQARASKEFVEILLDKGAELSIYEGMSPLETAIVENSDEEIILLLMDVNCPLSEGSNIKFVERLLLAPLGPNKKGRVLKKAVELYNIDLNQPIEDKTILELAIEYKLSSFVLNLIINGVKFQSHLHEVTSLLSHKQMEKLAEFLSTEKSDISEYLSLLSYTYLKTYVDDNNDLSDKYVVEGISLNRRIKSDERLALLQACIEKKADINLCSDERHNPLYAMTKNIHPEEPLDVISFLLENGALIEYNGYSALFYALSNYHMGLIGLFLENGANVNFIDANDEGVANYFFKEHANLNSALKRREVLKLLLKHGLDVNNKTVYISNAKKENKSEKDHKPERQEVSAVGRFMIEKELRLVDVILEDPAIKITDEDIIFYAIENVSRDHFIKELIALNPAYVKKDYYKKGSQSADANILNLGLRKFTPQLLDFILDNYPEISVDNEVEPAILDILDNNYYPIELVKKLISKLSDINRTYLFTEDKAQYTSTLLLEYAKKNRKVRGNERYHTILSYLLEQGADPKATAKSEEVAEGQLKERSIFIEARPIDILPLEVYDLLYAYGASLSAPVGESYESPLMSLISRYDVRDETLGELMGYAFSKEAFDLEQKDKSEYTLLLAAAAYGLPHTTQSLITLGADIEAKGGANQSQALHHAITSVPNVLATLRLQVSQRLLDAGINFEVKDKFQMTPLMAAAEVGAGSVAHELITRGADVNATDANGSSVLHRAILGRNSYDMPHRHGSVKSKIIVELVEAGANINHVADYGGSALVYAIDYGDREIFDTLLRLNADINTTCSEGFLPLYYAQLIRDQYFANTLFRNPDLQINKTDVQHRTILHQLLEVDFPLVVFEKILKSMTDHGADINHKEKVDPVLLYYVKMMSFVSRREVGFTRKEKAIDPVEDKKAKALVAAGADVKQAKDIAEANNESDEIIDYLSSLPIEY